MKSSSKMKTKRFETQQKSGMLSGTKIITDTQTGVQYLFVWDGYAGGLTLLVDKEGKPMIDENFNNK